MIAALFDQPENSSRRIWLFAFLAPLLLMAAPILKSDDRPNVIVIMSDDQGGGDYGFMGNKLIRTPQLDAMAAKSGLLNQFYVSPVCAPTRACLMTGRYNYRTRCIDTYVGRAMMDPGEITVAEMLQTAGYQTGIYGKWHLGDNYPMRPMDQGFMDSLVHRGGGIGQPSDPYGAEGKYTDPTLFRDGKPVALKGYCTDLYFDAAIDFISKNANDGKNFFTYIATNAPHGPFHDVPKDLYEEYRHVDFSPIVVSRQNPKRAKAENDKLARIAAMITNIDQNIGKLFRALDRLKIRENTIVIYLNDNGPNSMRYVGNMRGMKSHVDDGGIRSPLIFHWPAQVKAATTSSQLCAHIDLFPTLLEACKVDPPAKIKIDGRSFLTLLTEKPTPWPARQIVLQSHRGNQPLLFHNFALHEQTGSGQHWKLVHPSGFGKEKFDGEPQLQLYDLTNDPRQKNDLAKTRTEVFQRLKSDYQDWFKEVSSTRPDNYAPPRIVVGTEFEVETVLTRQDWRHASGRPWGRDSNGFWLLKNDFETEFEIELILPQNVEQGKARIRVKKGKRQESTEKVIKLLPNQRRGHKTVVQIPKGEIQLSIDVINQGKISGPHQVILKKSLTK